MNTFIKKLLVVVLFVSLLRVVSILAGLVLYIPILDPFIYGIRDLLVQIGRSVAATLGPKFNI